MHILQPLLIPSFVAVFDVQPIFANPPVEAELWVRARPQRVAKHIPLEIKVVHGADELRNGRLWPDARVAKVGTSDVAGGRI